MVRLRLTAMLMACASLVLGLVVSPPAQAVEVITTQPYFTKYNMQRARDQGATGAGVTIGMVDGPVDTSVPELAGADITVKYPCEYTAQPESIAHGTAVASILVSQDYGWAPDATLISYASPVSHDDYTPGCGGIAWSVQAALNDGVDIITVSQGAIAAHGYELIRAERMGVPVVVAAGNSRFKDDPFLYTKSRLTIGVAATDLNGRIADFSDYGEGITVSAPGTNVTIRWPDEAGALTTILPDQEGASMAAPMVAGLMALTMQQWPEATGNQIIRQLINTADEEGDGWDQYYGWGTIKPRIMTFTDPTGLEDTNPLWDKFPDDPDVHPTPKDVADYDDGMADPGLGSLRNDPTYVYRGLDETIMRVFPDQTQLGTSPRYDE